MKWINQKFSLSETAVADINRGDTVSETLADLHRSPTSGCFINRKFQKRKAFTISFIAEAALCRGAL
jgi:hypothetical protein